LVSTARFQTLIYSSVFVSDMGMYMRRDVIPTCPNTHTNIYAYIHMYV